MPAERHLFIAGAQRSGTTYLYRMLEQHPDICMARPMRPEPKYFLTDHAPGPATREDYLARFFAHRAGETLLGEKSTSYIESEAAAARIAAQFPSAHIVFMLRDPVRRAISNYRFSRENGLETLPIEEALEAEPARLASHDTAEVSVSPFAYVARGRYADYLDAWRKHVDASRMHLLVSERLLGSAGAMRQLFEGLGVQPDVPLAGLSDAVNGTAGESTIDARLARRLRAEFVASNQRLADEYGVDVSPWT